MTTERWLTLPERAGLQSEELTALLGRVNGDGTRAWDSCEEPRLLVELAVVAGLPVDTVLVAVGRACTDAWSHWTAGATDARPMQIVNAVMKWLRRDAGFEQVWATWELAEKVRREVHDWYQQQQGAVVASAILNAVEAVHAYATLARDLAEPEAGHDQHDPARYVAKNAASEHRALLHRAAEVVRLATSAGSWFHSHTEPNAEQEDHDAYAQQILGFVIRQNLPSEEVTSGLASRLSPAS